MYSIKRTSSPSTKSVRSTQSICSGKYSHSYSLISKETSYTPKPRKKNSHDEVTKDIETERIITMNGRDVTPLPFFPEHEILKSGTVNTYDDILKKFSSKSNALPWLVDNIEENEQSTEVTWVGEIREKKIESISIETKGPVKVILNESFTNFLFVVSGSTLSSDSKNYIAVREKNVLLEQRSKKPTFVDCCTETYYRGRRNKGSTSFIPSYNNRSTTSSEINSLSNTLLGSSLYSIEDMVQAVVGNDRYFLNANLQTSLSSVIPSSSGQDMSVSEYISIKKRNEVINSSRFAHSLRRMERVIIQNNQLLLQMKYHGIQRSNITEETCDSLMHLYTFKSDISMGKRPTCMCWYMINDDLLIAGYTTSCHNTTSRGCVMFWSIRNPSYPEYLLEIDSGVMAIALSPEKSSTFLAVGLQNGCILLYEKYDGLSLRFLSASRQRHFGPVSGLLWVQDRIGESESEVLLSLGVDGKILMWSISKGLVASDFSHLPKIEMGIGKGIFPYATGLCLNMKSDDSLIMAGSADGYLHFFSFSRSSMIETDIFSFRSHSAPIQHIDVSPFLDDIILTCSSDWTIKLWKICEKERELINICTFQSQNVTEKINCVRWCPFNATVFVSACGGGIIQVWDLSVSLTDPLFSRRCHSNFDVSSVLFSDKSPILVAASENGVIEVLSIHNSILDKGITGNSGTKDEQADRMRSSLSIMN